MKLPSKPIALVVVLSLAAIFAYQAYWLVNLYRTQCRAAEHDIMESMRISDYNEIILRVEQMSRDSLGQHGEVSVSAGYHQTTPYVESRLARHYPASTAGHRRHRRLAAHQRHGLPLRTKEHDAGTGRLLPAGAARGAGRHPRPGLPDLRQPAARRTAAAGAGHPLPTDIPAPGQKADSGYTYIDTLGIRGTAKYIPSARAKTYEYSYDLHDKWLYLLTTEPLDGHVLRQMAGILATSAVILLVLGFSFWYLIRILLRQRTLEEMKDDFTNNMTHELKTPIAVAYAANDALLNFGADADTLKRTRYLRICQEQLARLGGLVEQILSLSMERRKTFRLHPETFPVGDILTPLIEEHKLKADKPVRISTRLTPPGLCVTADRTHLTNIVSNLIDNAIKYSNGQADVEITGRKEGETIVLSVQDHGIGIPKDKLAHVFDKFYRVPTGNLHEVKGYGLGLYYVKTMVERHGGTVEVESEPGGGSKFTIKLRIEN